MLAQALAQMLILCCASSISCNVHPKICFKDCFMIFGLIFPRHRAMSAVVLYRAYCKNSQQTLTLQCLQDQVEKLKTSREAAVSLELQELRSAQEAAQAKLAQAEATISALTSEKDTFAKRYAARSISKPLCLLLLILSVMRQHQLLCSCSCSVVCGIPALWAEEQVGLGSLQRP